MIKQFFYVYRITIFSKFHYYGARSTNVRPEDDLGIHYFSSSFLVNKMISMSAPVKYKIIKEFSNFTSAIDYEIKLHNRFDVENHPFFLNQRNQRSSSFCCGTKGKVAIYDIEDNVSFVSEDKALMLVQAGYRMGLPLTKTRRNFTGTFKGKTHTTESKQMLSEKRSIGITVVFNDNSVINFKNRLELGTFLGMSPQLGAKLVRDHWRKDLWCKYNIKDILKHEDCTNYKNSTATSI